MVLTLTRALQYIMKTSTLYLLFDGKYILKASSYKVGPNFITAKKKSSLVPYF